MISFKQLIEKQMKGEDPCWDDYEMIGMKEKDGKKIPNCVPKEEYKSDAQRKAVWASRNEKGISEEEELSEANIPVEHAVKAVTRVLGSQSAARFASHLKPGTEKHTSWDKVNNALKSQGVKPHHIAKIAVHVRPAQYEEVELDEADLTKIDTATLRHLAALHRRNAEKNPASKKAAEQGEAELKRREMKEEVKCVAEAGTKPRWMLKQDPKLAAKVKAKTDLAKKRQASYGDPSAGKSADKKGVAEEVDLYEALDFKKEAAKHMKDLHDKNSTPASKAYAQKMLQRALEASKMKDKVAAAKHYMGEEVEPIEELSKATVKSYAYKRADDLNDTPPLPFHKKITKHKAHTSYKGLTRAMKRLSGHAPTSEEVEPIEELSKSTLGKYIRLASRDASRASASKALHKKLGHDLYAGEAEAARKKRQAGIDKATHKLASEDVELQEYHLSDEEKEAERQHRAEQSRKLAAVMKMLDARHKKIYTKDFGKPDVPYPSRYANKPQKEEVESVAEGLNEMDKSAPQPGRDGGLAC